MNLPVYLAGLMVATLSASVCLMAILVYFDPASAGSLIFILFYLSLFIASTGIFTLVGLAIRWFSQKRILRSRLPVNRASRHLEVSFRQGVLLAAILVIALILQSHRILAWWNLLVLVVAIGLIEWWLMKR
jgi:uncharacterized membrane protein YidH (DUF202 family)